jgi:hypothetical protein
MHRLGALLEFVTPATVLDCVLNRGWGRKPDPWLDEVHRSDFRIRRSTLGPFVARRLFPPAESQGDYWPPSMDYALQAIRKHAAQIAQLRFEFWKVIETAEREYAPTNDRAVSLTESARRWMPDWFIPLTEQPAPSAVPEDDFLDRWSEEELRELHNGIWAFAEDVKDMVARKTVPDLGSFDHYMRRWHRSWLRTIRGMLHDLDDIGEDNALSEPSDWPTSTTAVQVMADRLARVAEARYRLRSPIK